MDFSHIVTFTYPTLANEGEAIYDAIKQRLSSLSHDHTTEIFDQDTKLRQLHQQRTQQMVYVVTESSAFPIPKRFLHTNWHTMPWGEITLEEFNQIAGDIPITIVSTVPNCEEVYLKACAKCKLTSNVKNFVAIDKFVIHYNLKFVGKNFLYLDHPNTDCKYLFNITNGKVKMPRLLLMEELWNRKLLDKALWGWNVDNNHIDDSDTAIDMLGSNFNFPYQTHHPIDETQSLYYLSFDKIKDTGPITGYEDCYFEVCTESMMEPWSIMITEKTIRSYMALKPSLQLNNYGHYNYLKSIGVELYDELFDYSIIEKPNLKDRIRGIADNLDRLAQISKTEMDKKILGMKDKMIHNKQVLLDLPIEPMPTPEIEYLMSHNIIPNALNNKIRISTIGDKWYSR